MRPTSENSDPELPPGSLSGTSIIISVNPNSGSTDRTALVDDIRQRLVEANFEVEVLTDVTQVVKRAGQLSDSRKLRTIVSAGGDGTASLLANRLPQGVPMAILPLGTENLLARHLGMSADAKRFVDVIILSLIHI